jgi:hypothetical protein
MQRRDARADSGAKDGRGRAETVGGAWIVDARAGVL